MTPTYQEPPITVCVLDYAKPIETRLCLESIKRHLKVRHKVILCDNGSNEDYPLSFVREGLVDQLIVNRESEGLGLGTRALHAATFSPWCLPLQNDQILGDDLDEKTLGGLCKAVGTEHDGKRIASVSIAGAPCGPGVYSERASLIPTNFYKSLEFDGLPHHGAGRYHNGPWREEVIQKLYAKNNLIHATHLGVFVRDNGVYAVREMGEGGVWIHRTDVKRLYNIVKPTKLNDVYPKFTQEESELALGAGWPDGKIPSQEIEHSFDCWSLTTLGGMEAEYVADLRKRFAAKRS